MRNGDAKCLKTKHYTFDTGPLGLSIVSPDENLSRLAGELKCKHRGKLSLVDAYVLAVAIVERATLVTCDSRVSELNLVPIRLLEPL